MMAEVGVDVVETVQCIFGFKSWGGNSHQLVPAKKPTKFMTNSWCIAKELDRRCDGSHVHQALLGGSRASNAAIYPEELCRQIIIGLTEQMMMDGRIASRGGRPIMALGV